MKTIARVATLSLLLMGFCFGQDRAQEIPKLTDNAALQYWFAFYFMYEPPPGEAQLPDVSSWPKRLSELYPTYVPEIDLFFIAKDKVPAGADGRQIDGQGHFRYMPEALRRKAKGGTSEMCVLQTRREDYFPPARGHVEGYADGHVEWKPRKPGEAVPDAAKTAMSNAKQLLLAMMMYQSDHPPKTHTPWDFVYSELVNGRTPTAEALKPGIVEICEKNRQAVTEYLRKASNMTRCDFGLDYSRGPLVLLPHLAKIRSLARNAIAYGKLLEAQGKPREAAEVYCDVMMIGPLVAQDNILISALVGVAVEKMGGNAIRCLLAHDPPAEVCECVLNRLSALPDPYIEMGPRVCLEPKIFRPIFSFVYANEPHPSLSLTEKDKEEIRKSLGGFDTTGLSKAEQEQAAKLMALLPTYYEEYMTRAEMAAEIMGEPFPTAAVTLAEMEKEVKDSPNPVIRMMLPSIPRTLTQQVKAQTDLSATRLLAAAALHKAKTGSFPEKLDDLKPCFPKGIPRDPIGDKEFSYRLDGGKPCLESAGPPPGVEGVRKEECVFSFADVLHKENTGDKWQGK